MSELLLRACHDLRAPLRALHTNAELLLKKAKEGPPPAENLNFIVEGASRIESLVNGLSDYAIALRVEETSFQPTRTDVLLRSVLAKLKRELDNVAAQVTYGDLPRVRGNPDRLMEIFEILLRNAVVYRAAAPPLIKITADRQTDLWLFAVRDNGRGIPAAYLEKIFQPFERLSAGVGSGTGLGLAICREIIVRHGGNIWAESEEGQGAVFQFTLPVLVA